MIRLTIPNKSSRPNFIVSHKQEVIDITVATTKISDLIKLSKVDEEATFLDDCRINRNTYWKL